MQVGKNVNNRLCKEEFPKLLTSEEKLIYYLEAYESIRFKTTMPLKGVRERSSIDRAFGR